ncbi:MAG: Glucose-6-phosphate isomerase [Methanoregulaceae archaeon PtaU1.Bin059]|nr:MAG: Glucose-6-phosphate isomerase [Methanoregulaceae archaeon PtaB.Bin152]OPY42804.1 MAG: Glucose-6-phosphate isomerase [Methanoregulaceae archaeon PtaU1.Bin059]
MENWREHVGVPEIRYLEDLRSVLRDRECSCSGPAYSMYRDVAASPSDRVWMASLGIRFDITCIPPAIVCGEHVKTKGHYHPKNAAGAGYPEIYQVFEGKAHYLLQARDLSEVFLVEAMPGDTVVVPPGFGHVTINPERGELVMANLVSAEFSSEYGFYEAHRGAAYYELSDGTLEKNPEYPLVPEPVRVPAAGFLPGSPFRGPIYDLVKERDLRLWCLNHPERFLEFFTRAG